MVIDSNQPHGLLYPTCWIEGLIDAKELPVVLWLPGLTRPDCLKLPNPFLVPRVRSQIKISTKKLTNVTRKAFCYLRPALRTQWLSTETKLTSSVIESLICRGGLE
ncbi:unnamed protein product [Protopolystoma xenopodis]|uniref:Uncharacterized protein n=1 Tax=Protopolystoma xenopodis TaxID=117903 RepID=A0A3S5A9E4_9PLAT|nr:unnamed protein product [Protopolystoma xenopodis]